MTQDVNVVLIDFPVKGKEMVIPNEDGSYTVLINAKLSHEMRIEAYDHAMRHIENDDFSKADVQQIEAEAHSVTIPDTAERIPADRFQKRLEQVRREKDRIQRKLQEKEREIDVLIKMHGSDNFLFDVAEQRRLYGGL